MQFLNKGKVISAKTITMFSRMAKYTQISDVSHLIGVRIQCIARLISKRVWLKCCMLKILGHFMHAGLWFCQQSV